MAATGEAVATVLTMAAAAVIAALSAGSTMLAAAITPSCSTTPRPRPTPTIVAPQGGLRVTMASTGKAATTYQQGGYNSGRGSGRYQERQDGYNGERWDQQGGYYQERRDACNGDRREQGRYNGGGRGNGGYQERRDAYNGNRQEQGRYNGGRGNGYQQHQDGYNGYRGGYYNSGRGNGGYHQGGNYRQRQAPKPKEEDKVVITEADFPALGGASQAQSQA